MVLVCLRTFLVPVCLKGMGSCVGPGLGFAILRFSYGCPHRAQLRLWKGRLKPGDGVRGCVCPQGRRWQRNSLRARPPWTSPDILCRQSQCSGRNARK